MSDGDIAISGATAEDLPVIRQLLVTNNLPVSGIDEHWRTFIVARDGDAIVGCGGAEAYKFAALIRSVAVADSHRGRGIGRRIVRQLLDRLASRGIREFYLLTTTAQPYFAKRGFKPIDRDEIHPQLLASTELQGACPDTAVCMRLVMLA
ncbi:MAG TPA: arsenic resistance N-acetyltransferase ArsN2 [Thermoanaerobaculia bacterium]|jgi:amino-acid N-acetyltransferase|nr:arsenic resistance N-acetyltransferase ArsN2 [Thermoanaerobaculia bacterium]